MPSSFVFVLCFFFFNDTATTEIYTLSLHDALPFWGGLIVSLPIGAGPAYAMLALQHDAAFRSEEQRLNSSHVEISYAVFCLKKKNLRAGGLSASIYDPDGGDCSSGPAGGAGS